jgi:hypothetical protein
MTLDTDGPTLFEIPIPPQYRLLVFHPARQRMRCNNNFNRPASFGDHSGSSPFQLRMIFVGQESIEHIQTTTPMQGFLASDAPATPTPTIARTKERVEPII